MIAVEEQLHLALTKALAFRLPSPAVYRLTGVDAERYLQGRLSQDIKNLNPGCFASSLLLSPQGRVQQVLRVAKLSDSFILTPENAISKKEQDSFVNHLLQFKVADDIYLEQLSAFSTFFSIRGKESAAELSRLFPNYPIVQYPFFSFSDKTPLLILPRPQLTLPGFDIFSTIEPASSCIPGKSDGYEMLRIYCGEAAFGQDITEKNIVSDLDLTNLVSFSKGCYAGQEVVEMSYARGRPNHRPVFLIANSSQDNSGFSRLAQAISGNSSRYSQIANLTLTSKPASPETQCGTITSAAYFSTLGEIRAQGYIKNFVARDQPLYLNEAIFYQIEKPTFS